MNQTALPRPGLVSLALLLLPVLLAGLLAWIAPQAEAVAAYQADLIPFRVLDARQLAGVLDAYDYAWPPKGKVPALELLRFPPGLDSLQPAEKKNAFLKALMPLAIAANERILRERKEVLGLLGEARRTGRWPARLQRIAARYEVDEEDSLAEATKLLLRRCNIVPVGLILAQAAKESGWGTSRFALEANNLFGMHTWNPDSGLAAKDSMAPRRDRVRSYPDLLASVRDYVYNLNVGHAYVEFRELRARQQSRNHFDNVALARTLGSYSQLGESYIRHLQQLIAGNNLERLPPIGLRPAIP